MAQIEAGRHKTSNVNVKESMSDVTYIRHRVEEIEKVLSNYPFANRIASLQTADLLKMINAGERIAGSARAAISQQQKRGVDPLSQEYLLREPDWGGEQFQVGTTADGYLKIIAPPLVKMQYKYSFYLMTGIGDALRQFIVNGNQIPIADKMLLVYNRIYSGTTFSIQSMCDNDNAEVGNITNVICAAALISDRADRVSFLYTSMHGLSDYTEIFLVPYTPQNLARFG